MQKIVRKVLRAVADYDPAYYDMYTDPHEAFFAKLYVERIRQRAEEARLRPPATMLEAGCQAGRLVVPLAALGFQVTGIDTSGFALRRAEAHARKAGVDATLIQADVMEFLRRQRERRYDIVVCAEVIYQSSQYRAMVQVLAGAVKPGGLLVVSHRSMVYYFVEALRHGDLTTARQVLARREGDFEGPFPERGYYNWQTEDELDALYKGLGLQRVALYPIDRCAWLTGMGPSQLTSAEREAWLRMELQPSDARAGCARYILVIAEQPRDSDRAVSSTRDERTMMSAR